MVHSAGVRMTKTSHLAVRTIASDTDPIMKRSTGVCPVAPQIIKSAFTDLAISFEITVLGEPYSIMIFTFSTRAAAARAL